MYEKGVKSFKYTHDHPYYGEMRYSIAKSGDHRIVYKAHWVVDKHQQQELLPVIFAVVTNDITNEPKDVMDFYEERGASENFNSFHFFIIFPSCIEVRKRCTFLYTAVVTHSLFCYKTDCLRHTDL